MHSETSKTYRSDWEILVYNDEGHLATRNVRYNVTYQEANTAALRICADFPDCSFAVNDLKNKSSTN